MGLNEEVQGVSPDFQNQAATQDELRVFSTTISHRKTKLLILFPFNVTLQITLIGNNILLIVFILAEGCSQYNSK
jgi:hypothetical protein